MFKKVIYVVKTDLHYYPPCVSQIRTLKKIGVNVEVWYGTSNQSALDIFDKENISYKCLGGKDKGRNKIEKLKNWYNFRMIFAEEVKKIPTDKLDNILFWFGTTETALPLIGKLRNIHYCLTSLELLDDAANTSKRKMFGKLASNAEAIVSCEETRSYIMKYWYGLERLPYTMPNKPYTLGVNKNAEPSCDKTRKAIEKISNKKFIIYQGIFQNIDYLSELAKALKMMDSDYYLVMMGFDTHNHSVIKILSEIYDKVIHIDSIPAPLHLEITSHATIGVVFYSDETLNKAFCAPNKIYEYSGFGIPAIANCIPGLINTIGKSGAAVCTDFKAEKLKMAIEKINANYEEYSKNAIEFYNSTDNIETMRGIVNDLSIIQID